MSMWEFGAAVDGWIAANCPEDDKSLSADDHAELWAMVQENM